MCWTTAFVALVLRRLGYSFPDFQCLWFWIFVQAQTWKADIREAQQKQFSSLFLTDTLFCFGHTDEISNNIIKLGNAKNE